MKIYPDKVLKDMNDEEWNFLYFFQNSSRQGDKRFEEIKNSGNCNTNEPEGKQEQPDDWIEEKRQQG